MKQFIINNGGVIINKRSGLVWSCDKVGAEYLIWRNNQSRFISQKSFQKNWKIRVHITKNITR